MDKILNNEEKIIKTIEVNSKFGGITAELIQSSTDVAMFKVERILERLVEEGTIIADKSANGQRDVYKVPMSIKDVPAASKHLCESEYEAPVKPTVAQVEAAAIEQIKNKAKKTTCEFCGKANIDGRHVNWCGKNPKNAPKPNPVKVEGDDIEKAKRDFEQLNVPTIENSMTAEEYVKRAISSNVPFSTNIDVKDDAPVRDGCSHEVIELWRPEGALASVTKNFDLPQQLPFPPKPDTEPSMFEFLSQELSSMKYVTTKKGYKVELCCISEHKDAIIIQLHAVKVSQ